MIQRIQSLLLALVLLFMVLFLFFPFGLFMSQSGETFALYHKGLVKVLNIEEIPVYYNYSISILVIIILSLTFLTIFSFRNRILQINLCGIIMFLLFVVAGSELWQFIQTAHSFPHYKLKLAFFYPYISLVLTWLARKFIRRDEELVRSADRIR
ncbi:MAG: DUF4293 domain-containing protein [Bacteroidales bacterium]|nr:DUF4293 domain-containing protein [Bacteroidales bacterium]